MLFINKIANAKGAIKYFDEGLAIQDYYQEKGEVVGKWHGLAAEKLGLSDNSDRVTKEDFSALINNVNPATGEQLTARNDEDRRPGYEFTFSVPKSVSIVQAITKDQDIRDAFESSVQETMKDVEAEFATRVRKDGQNDDRITGNGIWASFTHSTSRPVDGEPDPHLHCHTICMNATFDEVEGKWKALELGDVKANGNYWQAVFDSKMAQKLSDLGYGIERTDNSYEIAGINRDTIDKFSRRTTEIEKVAASNEKYQNLDFKAELGKKTRSEKLRTGIDEQSLHSVWNNRLDKEEKDAIWGAKNGSGSNKRALTDPEKALEYSLSHILERKSVTTEKELLETTLKKGFGSFSLDEAKKAMAARGDLLAKREKKETVITTKEALKEEEKLIQTARNGRGKFKPLNPDYVPQNEQLTDEQKKAVSHTLNSTDFITIVAGSAGTGKTWSVKEIKDGVEVAGKNFVAFAPSAEASRGVQRGEGFHNAETVANLLQNPKLQEQAKDGVIWIDEAGMVGNKTMNAIVEVAKKQNARLLLTGDIKQHNSVEAGDALRIIQSYGGVKPAYITEVKRQKSKDYKEAVKLIADGKHDKGFERLDKMGAIQEIVDGSQRNQAIAKDYAASIKAGENAIIVTPTHKEGKAVTDAIRLNMKENNLLDKAERSFTIQKNLSFTEAQKQDAASYRAGHSIQFHQNGKNGFNRGDKYSVTGKDENGNVLVRGADEQIRTLPLSEAKKYQVFERSEIAIAKGDRLRITTNGTTVEKKRLNNGDIFTVSGFDKNGNILIGQNKTLAKDYANFTHGYYTTSHGSQGKSVNRVIIAESAASFRAASREQFYVSASRGQHHISIYTDDKAGLLRAVQKSSTRKTAMEIAYKGRSPEAAGMMTRLKLLYTTYYSRVKDGFVAKLKGKAPNTRIAVLKPNNYGKPELHQTIAKGR